MKEEFRKEQLKSEMASYERVILEANRALEAAKDRLAELKKEEKKNEFPQ